MPSFKEVADLRLDDLITLGPDDSLAHYGIKGQKWGIRRYQNADGTLTEAGKKHYKKNFKAAEDIRRRAAHRGAWKALPHNTKKLTDEIVENELKNTGEYKRMKKASDAIDKYEDDISMSKREYDGAHMQKLYDEYDAADRAYSKLQKAHYKKHEQELLSARLSDLKVPNSPVMQSLYREYAQETFKPYMAEPDDYILYLGFIV